MQQDSHQIQNITSPPYFPESNGLVEKTIGTLSNIIKKTISEHDSRNWSKYVPEATRAINSSKHSRLKQSPFYMLHGFEPRLRDEVLLGTADDTMDREQQILLLQKNRNQAIENLKEAQNYQNTAINQHRQQPTLRIGDLVLALTPVKNNKLQPEYEHQPYEIVKIISENIIKIKRIDKFGTEIIRTVHTGQIKPYNERQSEEELQNLTIPNQLMSHNNDTFSNNDKSTDSEDNITDEDNGKANRVKRNKKRP